MNKKIGIIDCNNFYVSCERVFNPISIGKPTIVLSNNDGCVIARSQEAKDLGIKMGEPFYQKKDYMDQHRFCVYSSNYNLYGDMSDRVMDVIKRYVSKVEVYSIDECFVDISDVDDDKVMSTLGLIRDEVKRLTGIPVSIGVGPNKTLAKLTSKVAKKMKTYNGICSYWHMSDMKEKIDEMDVEDIWGIGRKWTKKLNNLGVTTVKQFVNMQDGFIRKLMNVNGLKTKMELMGYCCHKVTPTPKQKKNIASTRSFGEDIDNFDQLSEAMYSYIMNGIKKLKDNEISPNRVTIFISGNKHKGEGHYYTTQVELQRQTRDVNEIWSQVYPQLKNIYDENKTYKKCGIIFNRLAPENIEQKKLFAEEYQTIPAPSNLIKKWEMKQDFISPRYTTKWDELPLVFV